MRVTTIVSLGASAVLGIGALFAAKFWLPDGEKDKVVQTAPVVVAAKPIEFGMKLDDTNLAVVQLPVEAAPAGSYRTIKEVIALDGGAPVALTALSPREAILPTKVSGPGARASVSAMISPGMRAYTVAISDVSGVGGHALPGDRVDILLSRFVGSEEEKNVETDVILQNVRVLGINLNANQTTADKTAKPKHTTLEVSPEDAAKLSIAAKIGSLSMVLRRTGAAEIEPMRPIRTSDVLPFGATPIRPALRPMSASSTPPAPPSGAPVAPKPRPGGLVVVNGTTRSTATSGAGA